MGLDISDGILVSRAFQNRPSLLICAYGRLDIAVISSDTQLGKIQEALSGFSLYLKKGIPSARDTILHPRAGFGLSADKRFLFFVVVDGRQIFS